MSPRFHTLTIKDVRPETPDAVSIAFDVPEELRDDYRFEHGQYLTLRTMMDGEEVRRSYSICSGVDDGELRVAIKKVEGGRFSTLANGNLKPGDRIDVMTPMGRFTVPLAPEQARTHVLIAAGSGITPILSIARTILAREPMSRVFMLYGNRTSRSIMFRNDVDDLKDRYIDRFVVQHVLSRERLDAPLANGRLDGSKLAAFLRLLVPAGELDHAFVCGPEPLVEESRETLARLGVPAERIHFELFTSPGAPVAVRRAAGAVPVDGARAEIVLRGVRTEVQVAEDENVVDAAIRAGLDLPYSCKGGMCCTCRAKVLEGKVEMAVNYSLEPWEVEAGFVLTCQSRPVSGRVVIDYDVA